jgi:hypothetical protein
MMNIILQIQTSFVSNLDPTDVQRIYDGLNGVGRATGCCGEGENTKVRIPSHEESDDLRICVITRTLVSLV